MYAGAHHQWLIEHTKLEPRQNSKTLHIERQEQDDWNKNITDLDDHKADKNNPHVVTPKQILNDRTVTGNDNATGTVTDTGGNLSIPIHVTVTAGTAASPKTSELY